MTDERKPKKREQQVENLELNRETLQDLTEIQAERAEGGARQNGTALSDCGCGSVCSYRPTGCN
jgi:hypothetical protein